MSATNFNTMTLKELQDYINKAHQTLAIIEVSHPLAAKLIELKETAVKIYTQRLRIMLCETLSLQELKFEEGRLEKLRGDEHGFIFSVLDLGSLSVQFDLTISNY